jgi:hypothetical protein
MHGECMVQTFSAENAVIHLLEIQHILGWPFVCWYMRHDRAHRSIAETKRLLDLQARILQR